MIKLTLKEILQDALICEKFMVSMYEQFLKEASNEILLDLLLTNFEEVAQTQHDIFLEMKDRDMYPIENAETQKIEQTMTLLKQATKTYSKDFK